MPLDFFIGDKFGRVEHSISTPDVAHQVKSYQRASQCGTLYDFLRGSGADRELEEGVKSDQTSQCVGLPTSTSPAFILL